MVVSSHLESVQLTKGILQAQHFRSMLTNSVFINTDRGAEFVENHPINSSYQITVITEFLDIS